MVPAFTPTGNAPVPALTLTPTPAAGSSVTAESIPLDVLISAGSDPTRTVNLGEQIVFTIELKVRESVSGSLFITTTIPEGTDYVPESSLPVQPNTVASTGTLTATIPVVDAARRTLRWQVQPMGAGQKFVARYAVQVNRATSSIVASASAVNSQTGQASTSNAVVLPTQPLAITLLRFETHPHPLGIKIVWQTGQEIETFGFVVFRSNSTDRNSATLITPKLIGAQGSGLGATYEYVDSQVAVNQQYSYWLQEVEADQTVHDYGPLSAVAMSQSPEIVIAGSIVAGGVPLPIQVSGVDQKVIQTAQAVIQGDVSVPTQVVNQVKPGQGATCRFRSSNAGYTCHSTHRNSGPTSASCGSHAACNRRTGGRASGGAGG